MTSDKLPDLWQKLESVKAQSIEALFADDSQRVAHFSIEQSGIYFDFSKTHLESESLNLLSAIAQEARLESWRDRLFAGEIVNISEGRPAEHCAERGSGNVASVERAQIIQRHMRAVVDAIEAGAFGEIRHILHIGIGGSALGPALVVDALAGDDQRYDLAVVSNVDGLALEKAVSSFDPHKTLIIVASKSFATTEALLNTQSALLWMEAGGVIDPYGRVIALTASPERAIEFGIDQSRILPLSETVGGRYSVWSCIGFPIALALGWEAFEQMLEGAAAMDRHFKYQPLTQNAPVMAAFVDLYYAQARGCETRAVFAYDERLKLLPSYLQQLEMESNGKSVSLTGGPVSRPTSPVVWGGLGTDSQHAVFQLLHQGTHLIPVEFISVAMPVHGLDYTHHQQLLANCFAQSAALMRGRSFEEAMALSDNDVGLARAKTFEGNRPSTTLLIDDLDPARLGALIAFYEHRTFVNAIMLEINPFDQWGVELGKELARKLTRQMEGETDKAFDPSTRALMERAFAAEL